MSETRTLERDGVRITVAPATVLIGMRRTRLQVEGRSAEESDPDRALLHLYTYPDLIAATVEAEGIPWPISFDDFLTLPDQLAAQWENAVYELNPHWLPGGGEPAEEKKEAQTISTGG